MTRLKQYSGVLGEGVTFLFGLGVKSVDEILKLRVNLGGSDSNSELCI